MADSGDEGAGAGGASVPRALAAYDRDAERTRQRRLLQRGDAPPTDASKRHMSKEDRLVLDTTADAILAVLEHRCGCALPSCVGGGHGNLDANLVRECRFLVRETTNMGTFLAAKLRGAVVADAGALTLDMRTGRVVIKTGIIACPLMFRRIFAIRDSMWSRMCAAVKRDAMGRLWGGGALKQRHRLRSEIASAWIRRYAEEAGCSVPNAKRELMLQIDARTLVTIWKLYMFEKPDSGVTYGYFCSLFNEEAKNPPVISMRKKKDVSSVCSDCVDLHHALDCALESGMTDRIHAAKAALSAHCERVRAERRVYFSTMQEAQLRPPPCLSGVADAMDNHKTILPSAKGALAHELKDSERMAIRLLGVSQHGSTWYAFLTPPWVHKGANLSCTALLFWLLRVRARGPLPPVLRMNVDGGSENWNQTTFAFYAHLVTLGIFKKVVLTRLPVGHTHNDLDAIFGIISMALHGTGVFDTGRGCLHPFDFGETLRAAFVSDRSKPVVVWLNGFYDFVAYYKDHLSLLAGYGASCQYTAALGEAPRMDAKRVSHLRVVHIQLDPQASIATARFATDGVAAERGEFYPRQARKPDSSPLAAGEWCSLDGHTGAAVLRSMPVGAPSRVQCSSADWDKLPSFSETLSKMRRSKAVQPEVVRAWESFLSTTPCELHMCNFSALLSPQSVGVPAPLSVAGPRELIGDPLIHSGRSKAQKDAEERGLFETPDFNVTFGDLEEGDLVLALAPSGAAHALVLTISGGAAPPVELLRIERIIPTGRKARPAPRMPRASTHATSSRR
jgi:hypothetical protein